jgi:hypothetical protein
MTTPQDDAELREKLLNLSHFSQWPTPDGIDSGSCIPVDEVVYLIKARDEQRERQAKIDVLRELKTYRTYKVGEGYVIVPPKDTVSEFVDTFDIDGFINDLTNPQEQDKEEV